MQEPQDRAQVPPAVTEVFHSVKVAQQLAEEHVTQLVVQLQSQVDDLERENAELLASSARSGLIHPVLRDALVGAALAGNQEWVPDMLGTVGFGPWETDEFDDFLSTREFIVRVIAIGKSHVPKAVAFQTALQGDDVRYLPPLPR